MSSEFILKYLCCFSHKNKVKSENTYDARPEAAMPYTGHLGDDYYTNYYSGSENGSTSQYPANLIPFPYQLTWNHMPNMVISAGLVPAKNSRAAGHFHSNSNYNQQGNNRKITLDEKYWSFHDNWIDFHDNWTTESACQVLSLDESRDSFWHFSGCLLL